MNSSSYCLYSARDKNIIDYFLRNFIKTLSKCCNWLVLSLIIVLHATNAGMLPALTQRIKINTKIRGKSSNTTLEICGKMWRSMVESVEKCGKVW